MANRRSVYGADGSHLINHILRSPTSFSFAPPSSLFAGSRSLLSFGDGHGRSHLDKSFLRRFDQDEFGDEDFNEYSHQPEKKRRLTTDQIQFLEKSFEVENKLEPDRKLKLAKDIGLQPRQVAVWFQNRRARWKTKTLERDYQVLQDSYNSLKANYDNLLRDNEKLKAVIFDPTDNLLSKEKEKGSSELVGEETIAGALQQERIRNEVSDYKAIKDSVEASKQEDLNSANSDVFDLDSPHHSNGFVSLLEPVDSYQSDLSQNQEDKLNNNLSPSLEFLKNGNDNYPDMPANSCYFGFQVEEDQPFGLWAL